MSDIKTKTKIGMVWNSIEKIVVQILSFILNIILARLLTPHDYGIIGLLNIYLMFSNVFIESGFSRALIQKQNRTEYDYSTALIFNTFVSVILYIILFSLSPTIARFYNTPELVSLERVFFLLLIINALSIVQSAKLQIELNFKKIAIISSCTTLLSGAIGIFAAYKGLGPWALVIQSLSKSLLTTIFYWILGKWFPKVFFSKESFKHLFGFGSKLVVSGLLGTTQKCITDLVIGKIYNPASLGYYTRAKQFPAIIADTLTSVLNTATFPLMAALQDKKEELVNTLKKLIKISAMFAFPAMLGLAVLAKPIVFVLLGEKWNGVGDLLFWLALSNVFYPYSVLNMNLLNAIGRSDLFLKVDMVKIPLDILMMIITFPISLKAIVIGKASTAIIYYCINTYMTGKLFCFGALKQLLVSWKYILSSIIMCVCVEIVKQVFTNQLLVVFLGIIVGVIVYSLSLFFFKDDEFILILNKIKKKVLKK